MSRLESITYQHWVIERHQLFRVAVKQRPLVCDDEHVHVLSMSAEQQQQQWTQLSPQGQRPSFVYGATLTALDDRRAVRFGGFQGGGYTNESNKVALLTLDTMEDGALAASWGRITINGTPPSAKEPIIQLR